MMINQVIKQSLVLSLFSTTILWAALAEWNVIGVFVGTLWGCVNLYLIGALAKIILVTKSFWAIVLILFVKFPLLYWMGYGLLSAKGGNPWFVMGGFSLIFLALFAQTLIQIPGRVG